MKRKHSNTHRWFPSGGAVMLLGAGFMAPAVIAWLADKNDSSNLPEVLFVLAAILFFTGLIRICTPADDAQLDQAQAESDGDQTASREADAIGGQLNKAGSSD